MKNLLITLGAVSFLATSPVILINGVEVKQQDAYSQEFYWNSNHSKVVLTVDAPWNEGAIKNTWYTFNIGSNKNISSMELSDSDGFSFSWGDTRYGPWGMGSISVSLDSRNNVKITSNNFGSYLQHTIFNETVTSGFAKCQGIVSVGSAWYQENSDYYFQFLIQQYLHPMNSFSGGTNFADIGTKIILK